MARRKSGDKQPTTLVGMPAAGATSSPDTEEVSAAAAERPVLEQARRPSTVPPPVGPGEGHDAWTVQRVSRQSTPAISTIDPAYLSTVTPLPETEIPQLALAKRLAHVPRPGRLPAEVSRGGALDLVDRSRPSQAALNLPNEMEDLYAFGDFTGALAIAELILGSAPDHEQAQRCAASCRERLIHFYSSKVGALTQIPMTVVQDVDLRWLGLDHRAGFLLSRVDGVSSVEEILDVCGMPRLEALKTLAELIERDAVRFEHRD